jgi:dihydroorotate dehydrogenase
VADNLLGERPAGLVLGVNLGKNKDTPLEQAAGDYLSLMKVFGPLADYLAINVSSPNTFGLRRLQSRQALTALLRQVEAERRSISISPDRKVPVLVKLSPDLTDQELDDALDAILSAGVEGVIATNTTIRRDSLKSPKASEDGGLSGAPLRTRSTQMVRKIYARTNGRLPIVGVGGVMNPAGAQEKLDAGAALVQLFSGLVYGGPGVVQKILKAL